MKWQLEQELRPSPILSCQHLSISSAGADCRKAVSAIIKGAPAEHSIELRMEQVSQNGARAGKAAGEVVVNEGRA